jgi:hypothetical protein
MKKILLILIFLISTYSYCIIEDRNKDYWIQIIDTYIEKNQFGYPDYDNNIEKLISISSIDSISEISKYHQITHLKDFIYYRYFISMLNKSSNTIYCIELKYNEYEEAIEDRIEIVYLYEKYKK